MKTFIELIKLFLWLLAIYFFVIGVKDLDNLLGKGVFLFMYFIILTSLTVLSITEKCDEIKQNLIHIINDIEIIDKKINKLQKYIED